jgi:hypothetical protein
VGWAGSTRPALNHPNICALFDVGPNFLVMEYVESAETACRILDVLDAAHHKGLPVAA